VTRPLKKWVIILSHFLNFLHCFRWESKYSIYTPQTFNNREGKLKRKKNRWIHWLSTRLVERAYLRLCFEHWLVKNTTFPHVGGGGLVAYLNIKKRTYIYFFQMIVLFCTMLHIGLVGLNVFVFCFLLYPLQCETPKSI
jgi:hypothetical protein